MKLQWSYGQMANLTVILGASLGQTRKIFLNIELEIDQDVVTRWTYARTCSPLQVDMNSLTWRKSASKSGIEGSRNFTTRIAKMPETNERWQI